MATKAASWAQSLQKKINEAKYGDFLTPETESPKNAVPGQSALYGVGAPVQTAANTLVPTYGEFMAQKSAENAANDIATGAWTRNVGGVGSTTARYGEMLNGAFPNTDSGFTNPPEGWEKEVSYADVQDAGGTEAPQTTADIIAAQKEASYAEAEAARERATVDARTEYAQNRATYGTNAETLAGMGLTRSGYGDYIESQAYAQQRADMQAAKTQEAAAKREADRIYYADMLAQRENAKASYAQILDAAKTGNYTSDEIAEMAGKYGISDATDLATLTGAATSAKEKTDTDKANAAYLKLLDMAKSEGYTADEIREAAKKSGITNAADIEALAKAAGDTKVKTEKENISSTITADTTDKEISDMIANGALSEENKAAAEEARKSAAEDEIEAYVNAKDFSTADSTVEKYYKSGVLNDDDRQDYYMERYAAEIKEKTSESISAKIAEIFTKELSEAEKAGKISAAQREELERYVYASAAHVTEPSYTKINITKYADHIHADIMIDGELIENIAWDSKAAPDEVQNALKKAAGENPEDGTLAVYDDGLYIYWSENGGPGSTREWRKLSRNWTVSGIQESNANKRLWEIVKAANRISDPTQ